MKKRVSLMLLVVLAVFVLGGCDLLRGPDPEPEPTPQELLIGTWRVAKTTMSAEGEDDQVTEFPAEATEQIYWQFTATEMIAYEQLEDDDKIIIYKEEPIDYTATEDTIVSADEEEKLAKYLVSEKSLTLIIEEETVLPGEDEEEIIIPLTMTLEFDRADDSAVEGAVPRPEETEEPGPNQELLIGTWRVANMHIHLGDEDVSMDFPEDGIEQMYFQFMDGKMTTYEQFEDMDEEIVFYKEEPIDYTATEDTISPDDEEPFEYEVTEDTLSLSGDVVMSIPDEDPVTLNVTMECVRVDDSAVEDAVPWPKD